MVFWVLKFSLKIPLSDTKSLKKTMKCDSFICDLQIVQHRFIVSLSLQKKQKGKLQNNIFGYKRVIYFNPRNQNSMLCDLYLCLKSFLAIKSGRESYLIFFFRDLQIVGGHTWYVCFMTILSSQKLKKAIPFFQAVRIEIYGF